MGLGGGEDEPDAGRRLLEHLQQGVEGLPRKPLGLVDDVHLLAAERGRGGGALAELARVVHASVRSRIDLDHVEVRAVGDPEALLTLAARLRGGSVLAVDHLGQDASGRGLAGPAGSAEQERVGQAPLAHRPHQRPNDVILPQHLVGDLGAVLAVQRLVLLLLGHLSPSLSRSSPGKVGEDA